MLFLARLVATTLVLLLARWPRLQDWGLFRGAMFGVHNGLAARYDRLSQSLSLYQAMLMPGKELVKRLPALFSNRNITHSDTDGPISGGPEHVIDFCSGTGNVTLQLAHALPYAQVVGLDFSPEMRQVAADKARQEGLGNVRFTGGDAANPGVHGEYDLATIQNAPLYMKAMAQAVRPGGCVAVMYSFAYPGPCGPALARFMRHTGLEVNEVVATGLGVLVIGRRPISFH